MKWREEAWRLKREDGLSWTEMFDEIRTQFPELENRPDQTIRSAVRNIDKKKNRKKRQPIPPPEEKIFDFTQSRTYKFGVVSDTHLNSREQQLTHLNRMYDLFVAEGVSDVYHAGDITAGEGMFTGQVYEIFNVGFDNQADYIIKKYPQRCGITTHFITGNHDLSYYKSKGVDIGEKIALKRPDMNYLGKWAAWVKLGENTTMYILHPDSGPAYAVSYKPQKIAAGFIGGTKPNIMCFPKDTKITMHDGSLKNIQDIKIGDKVITHKGNIKSVTDTFVNEQREGKIVDVYGIPSNTFKCTKDHPLWVLRDGQPQWVKAKDLTKKDWIGRPILKGEQEVTIDFIDYIKKHYYRLEGEKVIGQNGKVYPRYIKVDKNFARLMGLFVAEGYTDIQKYRTSFAFHQNEEEYTEFVVNTIKNIFGVDPIVTDRKTTKARVIRINDLMIADFFSNLISRYASNKDFPDFCLTLPLDIQNSLLQGVFEGDGFKEGIYYTLSTTSRKLAEQVLIISARLNLSALLNAQMKRTTSYGQKPCYTIRVAGQATTGQKWYDQVVINQTKRDGLVVNDFDFVWHHVRKISDCTLDEPVYNFEVEDDNSYIASSLAVHNCLGHWHQIEYLFERNIHIIQAGCFEGQSPYLKRKGIMPKIGGWIIEIHIDRKGTVSRFKSELVSFFEPLKDDY